MTLEKNHNRLRCENVKTGYWIESILLDIILSLTLGFGMCLYKVINLPLCFLFLFLPFLIGYPFRFFMLKRNGTMHYGDVIHEYITGDGRYSSKINYDAFSILKPWAYIHGEYVFARECGIYGILRAFCSVFFLLWVGN
jgi:hypothetical protein